MSFKDTTKRRTRIDDAAADAGGVWMTKEVTSLSTRKHSKFTRGQPKIRPP
jgi:hypothetical protein